MRARLIVMLKYPRRGNVKTRLAPVLGEQRACALYRALATHTVATAMTFARDADVDVELRVAGAPDHAAARAWLGGRCRVRDQGDGDLGERLARAAHDAFAEHVRRVVIIGGDCPGLGDTHLHTAFAALEQTDLAIGPAADGGYYLLGMRRFTPELFRGIAWGTEEVRAQTLAIARTAGLSCQLLEELRDIDCADDLPYWARSAPGREFGRGGMSVIVPALNEAEYLPATLEAAVCGAPHELIVVDGDSTDLTREIARVADAAVLVSPRGRARQMNAGAAIATGEFLLFLHADTLLPEDYSAHVRAILGDPRVAAGAFAFALTGNFFGRRLIERTTNWRARARQLPFGDQGIFLRRDRFEQMGGFADVPLLEDYLLVRRLRNHGRLGIAPASVRTSDRRYRRLGPWRTTLLNQAILVGHRLGVPLPTLARWYRGADRQPGTPSTAKSPTLR